MRLVLVLAKVVAQCPNQTITAGLGRAAARNISALALYSLDSWPWLPWLALAWLDLITVFGGKVTRGKTALALLLPVSENTTVKGKVGCAWLGWAGGQGSDRWWLPPAHGGAHLGWAGKVCVGMRRAQQPSPGYLIW